jgi:hypothetical protein
MLFPRSSRSHITRLCGWYLPCRRRGASSYNRRHARRAFFRSIAPRDFFEGGRMHRIIVVVLVAFAFACVASPLAAQTPSRPAETPRAAVAPGDEIKLDEPSVLKANAIESRIAAILANFALLQRQAQDLQTEMKKSLEDRKKVIDDAARKSRVDVREATEWVYDEPGQRYIRAKKTP